MTDILKAIEDMRNLQAETTNHDLKVKTESFILGDRYRSYDVVLSYEFLAKKPKPGQSSGSRGVVASFPGSQSFHEYEERRHPRSVRTSHSWEIPNKSAKADAEMFVLLWNNREELMRLAEIGSRVEVATKVPA